MSISIGLLKYYKETNRQIVVIIYYQQSKKNIFISFHSYFILFIIQLSLDSDGFFKTTNKYLNSYLKDAKKINPDFEHITQLYGVVIDDIHHVQSEEKKSQASNLIQIDINLTIQGKYFSESLLYNTENLSYIKTRNFAEHFVNDLLKQNSLLQLLSKQAIQELQQQVRIQIRSQCLYKTLLRKHASTLLNFSTIEIPSEVKEYLIPIQIKLKNQQEEIEYEDYFEWDILNENNNIEQFCEQLLEDAGLDQKYYSQLCYVIRNEINLELEWKFMLLVKTFKPIHKDREQPKLNIQTTSIIKKNLPYTMDVQMVPENKAYEVPENLTFINTDVYSLLTRNFDILPEEFQNYLQEKQNKQGFNMKQKTCDQANPTSIQKAQTEQAMVPSSHKITSSHINNKSHTTKSTSTIFANISTQDYDRQGIKIQSNPYLSGVSKSQCQKAWRKIISEQRTIIE